MKKANRRLFLRLGVAASGALTACKTRQTAKENAETEPNRLGKPLRAYGERSPFEKTARLVPDTKTPELGSTRTPLAETLGMITPSSLHFERHHAGVPQIDPERHRLLIDGLVERPLVVTLGELKRLPSESRIYFVECAGNSGSEWGKGAPNVTLSHGLASCSEWTGVRLSVLLQEAGLKASAKWILAEGADPCKMYRSLPLAKAMEDSLVAYGQNGEALRPEQGYPLRLVVPGWEGNVCVKWLHRVQVVDQPYMYREETSHYTDLMPDGTARQFTFVQEAKSVITRPSGGQKLDGPGVYEITGLAWSGRGRIERVDVSTDGGKTWWGAQLQEPRLKMAFTRFRMSWQWDGKEARIASRCTDDTGYTQPMKEALIAARGTNSNYHNNAIKIWTIAADGSVANA